MSVEDKVNDTINEVHRMTIANGIAFMRECDEWKARAEKAEAALRNGLSYEELRGAFDALTTLYEAALARAMTERTSEEIEAAAEVLYRLKSTYLARWKYLNVGVRAQYRNHAAHILAAADAVREKADAARRGMVEGGGR